MDAGPGLRSPRSHVELVRERQNGSVCVVDGFGASVERKAAGSIRHTRPPTRFRASRTTTSAPACTRR
jgi:hypothetical protein